MDNPNWHALAREEYASDEIEIDDNALTSIAEDDSGVTGAWVQAWVWVDAPEASDG